MPLLVTVFAPRAFIQMKYTEFRDAVHVALCNSSGGLTWQELKVQAQLPYSRPCPEWIGRLEKEIGLRRRAMGSSKAHTWSLPPGKRKKHQEVTVKEEKTSSSTVTASASSGNKRQRGRSSLPQRTRSVEHVNPQPDAQGFSVAMLREALDTQRQMRQLSWAAATRQINREDEGCVWKHPISVSSVSKVGQNKSGVAEGDGVLQMLIWLNRSPESFVMPKIEAANSASHALPSPKKQILRWDTTALHAALDRKRVELGVSWNDVASAVGGGWAEGTLTRLAKGGRVSFPGVMRLVLWIGQPAAKFTTCQQHPTEV